jgi:hypothetical protein
MTADTIHFANYQIAAETNDGSLTTSSIACRLIRLRHFAEDHQVSSVVGRTPIFLQRRSPMSPDHTTDAFQLEGFLVSGDEETIRLVMSPYVLHLRRESVLSVEELPPLSRQQTSVGIAVRLSLKTGCPLLGITDSGVYDERLWRRRRPFSIVTRHAKAPMQDDGSYAELESTYLRERGIEV